MQCLKRLRSISLALVLLPSLALAQVTPVIFERTDIRIDPSNVASPEGQASLLRDASSYNIELRSEDALKLEYIHTLNSLTDTTGVMILFSAPIIAPLPAMQVYTPVDALFIGPDGRILQILPNVALGDMKQDIMANDPVQAFLFLKAGEVAARLIQPQDVVVGTMFVPAPPMMQ